jgi:hypothetical protein
MVSLSQPHFPHARYHYCYYYYYYYYHHHHHQPPVGTDPLSFLICNKNFCIPSENAPQGITPCSTTFNLIIYPSHVRNSLLLMLLLPALRWLIKMLQTSNQLKSRLYHNTSIPLVFQRFNKLHLEEEFLSHSL